MSMIRKLVVLDFETRGLKPEDLELDEWILGFAYGTKENDVMPYKWDVNSREGLRKLAAENTLLFFNATFELSVFRRLGIEVPSFEDAAQLCYVLYPDIPMNVKGEKHSLGAWAERFGYKKGDSGVVDKDWRNATWNEQMALYCVQDVVTTIQVYRKASDLLAKDKKAKDFYFNVALPFCRSVVELEMNGLHFDRDELTKFIQGKQEKCDELLKQMRLICPKAPGTKVKYNTEKEETEDLVFYSSEMVEDKRKSAEPGAMRLQYTYQKMEEFNPSSSNQVAWALSEVYGWEPQEFTDAGNVCCDGDVLEALNYPLAKLLVEYSENNKLITSFGESILTKMDENGFIYPSVNNTGTVTGRLSMSSPNLQNLPHSPEYRACITAPEGRKLVGCDMGGFQLKIIAYFLQVIAGVGAFLDKLNSGLDAHTATAQLMGIDRRVGKTLNFAIAFGAGAAKTAVTLGAEFDEEAAAKLLEDLGTFLGVTKLKHLLWALAEDSEGVIHDIMGRRLVYPGINSEDKQKKSSDERRVFNALIQSTEASVMQHLTERIRIAIMREQLDAHLVVQVHDELVVEASDTDAERVRQIMTDAFSDKRYLPLLTSVDNQAKIGNNWREIH